LYFLLWLGGSKRASSRGAGPAKKNGDFLVTVNSRGNHLKGRSRRHRKIFLAQLRVKIAADDVADAMVDEASTYLLWWLARIWCSLCTSFALQHLPLPYRRRTESLDPEIRSCPKSCSHRTIAADADADARRLHLDSNSMWTLQQKLRTPSRLVLSLLLLVICSNQHAKPVQAFTSTPFGVRPDAKMPTAGGAGASTTLTMTTEGSASPSTFREAEVLGLKLMQEQKYEEALKGS